MSETAVPGLVDRLTAHRLPEAAAALEMSSTGRRVTAVAFPFHLGGLTWQPPAAEGEASPLPRGQKELQLSPSVQAQ